MLLTVCPIGKTNVPLSKWKMNSDWLWKHRSHLHNEFSPQFSSFYRFFSDNSKVTAELSGHPNVLTARHYRSVFWSRGRQRPLVTDFISTVHFEQKYSSHFWHKQCFPFIYYHTMATNNNTKNWCFEVSAWIQWHLSKSSALSDIFVFYSVFIRAAVSVLSEGMLYLWKNFLNSLNWGTRLMSMPTIPQHTPHHG